MRKPRSIASPTDHSSGLLAEPETAVIGAPVVVCAPGILVPVPFVVLFGTVRLTPTPLQRFFVKVTVSDDSQQRS